MPHSDPMKKAKEDYQETIKKIAASTAVGIDPQLTHAIIIDYLQQINQRLDRLEKNISPKI